jgi:hypothetical protein
MAAIVDARRRGRGGRRIVDRVEERTCMISPDARCYENALLSSITIIDRASPSSHMTFHIVAVVH